MNQSRPEGDQAPVFSLHCMSYWHCRADNTRHDRLFMWPRRAFFCLYILSLFWKSHTCLLEEIWIKVEEKNTVIIHINTIS